VTLFEDKKTTQGRVFQRRAEHYCHWVENAGDQATTTISSMDHRLALDAALSTADVDIHL
jgi:hypothetical protein